MTREEYFKFLAEKKEKKIRLIDCSEEFREDFLKAVKKYDSLELKAIEKQIEEETKALNEMTYKTVKGLKRPIRVGNVNSTPCQIDNTGLSIGEKVQRFLLDNTVAYQDVILEYDEEESTDLNPDWSGDGVELSEVDDIGFDKVDVVDKQRELKDKIEAPKLTNVESGDIPSSVQASKSANLQSELDSTQVSEPITANEK